MMLIVEKLNWDIIQSEHMINIEDLMEIEKDFKIENMNHEDLSDEYVLMIKKINK